MPKLQLSCAHVDTCLPDYWGGHSDAHVQIPVHKGMTLKAIKASLHSELDQGFVMGGNPIVQDDSGPEGDKWYAAAHAAVNKIKPRVKGQRTFFNDLEEPDEDEQCDVFEDVYAYFVFAPEESKQTPAPTPDCTVHKGCKNQRSYELRSQVGSDESKAVWSLFLYDVNRNLAYAAHDRMYMELKCIALEYLWAGKHPNNG